jgi:hypothetical protein
MGGEGVSVQVREITSRRDRPDPAPNGAATGNRPAGRSRWLEIVGIVALLGFVGVVVPVLVADHYGALGIPRSDDWSYLLTLFRWVDNGTLNFNGWVSMTLVGQVLAAAPLVQIAGRDITTVQLFTSMLGLVGLLGVVFIGRQMLRPPWWAVFVAVTIAVGPLWGPLAPTFMTDVPTFTFEMLTIAAAAVAFRTKPLSMGWLTTSIVLGFYGITIRQYAIVPVIAIVIVALLVSWSDRDWKQLRAVLAIAGTFTFAALVFLFWWSGLPDSKSLSPSTPDIHSLSLAFSKGAGFLRLTGLLIVPVVALAGPVGIVRRAWRSSRAITTVLTLATSFWLAAAYLRLPKNPFVGNYVSRDGVLSYLVLRGRRPDVMPGALFDALVVLGSVSAVIIVLAAVPFLASVPQRIRNRNLLDVRDPLSAVMALAIAGFAAAYGLALLTGLPVFDRYALPVLPLVALVMLRAVLTARRDEPQPARTVTRTTGVAITFALLAAIGLVYTADSASFDATRWHLAAQVQKMGYPAKDIEGGFEWLGYHRERDIRRGHLYGKRSGPCVVLRINPPRNNARIVIASAESTAISRDPATIVAERTRFPCSGTAAARAAAQPKPTPTPAQP